MDSLLPLLADRAVGVRRAAIAGLVENLTLDGLPDFASALEKLGPEARDPLLQALRKDREDLYLEILSRREAGSTQRGD
jgi:HEAT repeat protein